MGMKIYDYVTDEFICYVDKLNLSEWLNDNCFCEIHDGWKEWFLNDGRKIYFM